MKEILLQKMYYGDLTHKMVIRHWKCTQLKTKKRWDKKQDHHGIVDWAHEQMGRRVRTRESGYWIQHESHTTLFFKDPSFVDLICDKFGDQVFSLERPKDDAHIATLKEKFITRKTLYYKHFRFRFKLDEKKVTAPRKYSWWQNHNTKMTPQKQRWEEINTWLVDHFPAGTNFNNLQGSVYINNTGWAPVVFFTDQGDATMFKLAWNDDVQEFIRVKLHSEI